MLFMTLKRDNVVLFQSQMIDIFKPVAHYPEVNISGDIFAHDKKGVVDPQWEELDDRWVFLFLQAGAGPLKLKFDPLPNQTITTKIQNQKLEFTLFEREIASALPAGKHLPTGAGEDYARQSFLAS